MASGGSNIDRISGGVIAAIVGFCGIPILTLVQAFIIGAGKVDQAKVAAYGSVDGLGVPLALGCAISAALFGWWFGGSESGLKAGLTGAVGPLLVGFLVIVWTFK